MLAAYFRERLPARVFAPIALALAAAAGGFGSGPRAAAADAGLALLLLAQFRMWDDLADRRHDAVAHPGRVLVQATSTRPALVLCVVLAVINLGITVERNGAGLALITLTCLMLVLSIWYARRGGRSAIGDLLLLTKYPSIVLILAGSRAIAETRRLLCAAAAVYLAACIYEAWHDPSSFGGPS